MAWITPKIDWVPSDFFTLDDWSRILNNFSFLYDLSGATFSIRDMQLANTSAMPYYPLVNNLEQNLKDLTNHFNFDFVHFDATTWVARTDPNYDHNPSNIDFNRWESVEQQLLTWWNIQQQPQNILYAGTFKAGTNRVTQMLSRGR